MSQIYPTAVGIRFAKVSKIYHYDPAGLELQINDPVIVETPRGKQIGTVVQILNNFTVENEPLKTIEKVATPRELIARETHNANKADTLATCKKLAKGLRLSAIKILDVEFSYDGNRMTLIYSSQTEEKADLKTLKYDIQKAIPGITVEPRQLGPRDVAKLITGMGACGLASRCCSSHLTEFSSISIKMAKSQGISLTPAEITGMCGRLRCCLVYENDYYAECRKNLPKKNKRVNTPQGTGKVLEVFPLRDAVLVDIPDVGRREFQRDQITLEEPTPEIEKRTQPQE